MGKSKKILKNQKEFLRIREKRSPKEYERIIPNSGRIRENSAKFPKDRRGSGRIRKKQRESEKN